MSKEKRFVIDVGMADFPYPMRVLSRDDPAGQPTVASISIAARISQEFEARWIDRLVQILHRHRDSLGTASLTRNVLDYREEFGASEVKIDFAYPFFVTKTTPASKETCLVRYMCTYSVRSPSLDSVPKILFVMEIPVITTLPGSSPGAAKRLFGQLSKVRVEVQSETDIFPEYLVDVVDRHALFPMYSYLTEDDQVRAVEVIHSEKKSSVVMLDEINDELLQNQAIQWFSVRCANFSMLHTYSTMVAMEHAPWVPFLGYEDDL